MMKMFRRMNDDKSMYSKQTSSICIFKHIFDIEFKSIQYLIEEKECSSVPMFIFEGMSKVSRHLIGDMFILPVSFSLLCQIEQRRQFIYPAVTEKEFSFSLSFSLLDSLSFFLSPSFSTFIHSYIYISRHRNRSIHYQEHNATFIASMFLRLLSNRNMFIKWWTTMSSNNLLRM